MLATNPNPNPNPNQVPSKFVLPLPLYEPSVYTAHNELRGGQMVLALYPDTTCFYKVSKVVSK